MHDLHVVDVAGDVQHFHVWLDGGELLGQVPSAHPWQNDVGQQKVDRLAKLVADLQGADGVWSLENGLPHLLKRVSVLHPDGPLVFDEENRFRSGEGLLQSRLGLE